MMKLSIVIPAYNEAQNLPNTIDKIYSELSRENIEHEILVSNDNSTVIDCVCCTNISTFSFFNKTTKLSPPNLAIISSSAI